MPTRSNRYYNDPTIGAAFSNLAQIFAPPSASDTYAYARAAAEREEAERVRQGYESLAKLLDPEVYAGVQAMGADYLQQFPEFDLYRRSTTVDDPAVLDPSVYAIFGDYGNTAAGEREALAGALEEERIRQRGETYRQFNKPIAASENETVFLPPELAGAIGMPDTLRGNINLAPGERTFAPGGELFEGAPKPTTGTPRNYVLPDGSSRITYDGVTDAQTGEPLPPGGFIGNVEGGAGDMGLTTSTLTGAQSSEIANQKFANLLAETRRLAQADPSNFGIPGTVKGFAQDMAAILEGLSQSMGFENVQGFADAVRRDAVKSGVDPSLLSGVFDPNLPALQTTADLLAYSAAAALAGQSGRSVSDRDVRIFKEIVGDPRAWMMNQERFLAKLDQLERLLMGNRAVDQSVLESGNVGAGAVRPEAPAQSAGDARTIQTPNGAVTIRRKN